MDFVRWESFRALMLRDLAAILGCAVDKVPAVFLTELRPKALLLGAYHQLLARYPKADSTKLERWFILWTRRQEYLQRLGYGRHRHGLDGADAGLVSAEHRRWARSSLTAIRAGVAASRPREKAETSSTSRPTLHLFKGKAA
jgi:sRNA-binding protein